MRCKDVREKIIPFVLDELGEEDSRLVSEHVGSCAGCRKESEDYRQTILAMGRWKIPAHGPAPVFALLPGALPVRRAKNSLSLISGLFARYGLRLTFAAALVAAFLMGTRVQFDNGAIVIAIGRSATNPLAADSSRIASEIAAAEKRNLQIVSELIAASEARQADMYKSSLETFSKQISGQQRTYMMYFTNHLYRLQEQNQLAYYQSKAALTGVMRLADAVK
ncbi:MAG TPA: zf-HC2 domain-containing protein [Candidatus Kryptonia bacterium]